eukprot:scaffold65_cov233-Pinguiococcus_pyrenoidosus.AAC.4
MQHGLVLAPPRTAIVRDARFRTQTRAGEYQGPARAQKSLCQSRGHALRAASRYQRPLHRNLRPLKPKISVVRASRAPKSLPKG